MTRTIIAAVLAVSSLIVSCAAASAEWMASDAAIRELVSGKRIYLETPFGGEFPLRYAANGRVSGDGTKLGLGQYFAPKETGDWWVEGGQLCQQFPTWYKGRTSCFKLQQTGAGALRWQRDDGYSGNARIAN